MREGKLVEVSWGDGNPTAIKIENRVYVYYGHWLPEPPKDVELVKTYYRSRSGLTGDELWFVAADEIIYLDVYRGKYGDVWMRMYEFPEDGAEFIIWDRELQTFEIREMPYYNWDQRQYPTPEWAREVIAIEVYKDNYNEHHIETTTGWIIKDWGIRFFTHPQSIKAVEIFPSYWKVKGKWSTTIQATTDEIIDLIVKEIKGGDEG